MPMSGQQPTPASAPPRRVLVVEDEPTIALSVAHRLRAEGYEVQVAGDGPSAVHAALTDHPDAMVLDVMLPGFDGLEVCRRVQAERPVPVLMLTARDAETDVLVGLGIGADDYMTKPFSPRELVARVKAILRRAERGTESIVSGRLEVNVPARQVRRDGELLDLTATEFDLLAHLARRPGVVHARERLLAEVW